MRAALIALMLTVASQAGAECGNLCDEIWWKTATEADVQVELDGGADVMARDRDGWTPLHWASAYGTSEDIQALLDAGANATVKDDYDNTPWDLAQDNDALKGTDALEMLRKAETGTAEGDGCGKLCDGNWWDGKPSKDEIISEIKKSPDINKLGAMKWPPLFFALFSGNLTAVPLLIEEGADVNILIDDGYGTKTPLHITITSLNQTNQRELRDKLIVILVAAGADPNIQDDNDMSGVDMARRNIDRGDPFGFLGSTGLRVLENPSLANEMLEEVHKSEKNSKKCGVLCDAEIWKSVASDNEISEFVLWAINNGHEVMAQSIEDHKSYPLHYAAYYGNPEAIELLVNAGADVSAKNAYGNMPIYDALLKPTNVEALIRLGSNVNDRNLEGDTPLHRLTSVWNNKEIEVIEQLLEAGANVNEKTDHGSTPFGLAIAFKNHKKVLEVLLSYGADITIDGKGEFVTDSNLHTASSLLSDSDILQLLIDSGLEVNIVGTNGGTPLHNVIKSHTSISIDFGKKAFDTVKFLIENGADTSIKNDFGETALDLASEEPIKGKITKEIVELLQLPARSVTKIWPKSNSHEDFLLSGSCEGPDIGVVNFKIYKEKLVVTDTSDEVLYEGGVDGPVQIDKELGWIYDEGKIIGKCELEKQALQKSSSLINEQKPVKLPLSGVSWGGKVRSGPGMEYRQIGSLKEGDPVELLENSEIWMDGFAWFKILFLGNEVGYKWGGILCAFNDRLEGVYSEKASGIENCGLDPLPSSAATPSYRLSQGIRGCSCGGKVRSGPGKQYSQTSSLSDGSPITLLKKNGTWYEISYDGGKLGYQWQGIMCTYPEQQADGVDPCCNSSGQCE